MDERKYFPKIPLLPEEREEALREGRPKLPGAPASANESILLSLPFLDRAMRDLAEYNTMNTERRRNFQTNKLREFLNNPKSFEEYFDTLRILAESLEGKREQIEIYSRIFFDNLEKLIDIGTLKPEACAGWLMLMVRSDTYRPVVERIFKTIIEKSRTPKAITGFMYSLAEAVICTEDQNAFKEGLRLLLLVSPFLGEVAGAHLNFVKGMFVVDDDDLLRKNMEVDTTAAHFSSKYAPEYSRESSAHRLLAMKSPEMSAFQLAMLSKDHNKFSKLIDFYKHTSGFTTLDREKSKIWPYPLVFQAGKVRQLFNDRVAKEEENRVSLKIPGLGEILYTNEALPSSLVSALARPAEDNIELKDAREIKAVFYLSPNLSEAEMCTLAEDVSALRLEIMRDKVQSISPRGDRMLVVDSDLAQLGFKSITFRADEFSPHVNVEVETGNYKFMLLLGADFVMRNHQDQPLSVSLERRAFVEHMILSHLKELMCTERVLAGEGNNNRNANGNGGKLERAKEFRSRRGHTRKLPPGYAYTREAQAAGLEPANPALRYDLVKINIERGFTKVTGQITYVKLSVKPLPGEEPIISRAPHAADRLKEILKKNRKVQENSEAGK